MSITRDFDSAGHTIAVDTETAMAPLAFQGRNHVRLLQVHSDLHSFCYDLARFSDDNWEELDAALRGRQLIFQNAAFDLRVLQGCGIDLFGEHIEDTMLQSYLLNNGLTNTSNSLEAIAKRVLGEAVDKTLQKQDWMNAELNEADLAYAMGDVRITFDAFFEQAKQIKEAGLEIAYEVELKALWPTIEMESSGLYLDRDELDQQRLDLEDTRVTSLATFVEELDTELQEYGHEGLPKNDDGSINLNKKTTGSVRLGTKVYAGFNPGSAQQVLQHFRTIGITPSDPLGKPSVDKKYLASWTSRSLIRTYLGWKRADKHLQMAATLVDHQAPDGRIYARFNPTGTFTGRYSSSGPNLQNIPRGDMRYCFKAPEGRELVDLDYGGMELRALCSKRIADEPAMREAFNAGRDVHTYTAALMFKCGEDEVSSEERRQAKAVNFGAAYGSGPQGLCNYFQSIGQLISREEGEAFLSAWLDAYPNIARWHQDCRARVEAGEPVRMVDGRRRWLVGDAAKHTVYANNTVQGSCASAMKLALFGIYQQLRALDATARLVGVIHDEVLIECAAGRGQDILEMAQQVMVEAGREIFGDDILLEAEGGVGDSWGGAKG